MTDNEIIKALECCGKGFGNCEGCPYDDENNGCVTMDGRTLIFQDTLDLINRQKAEIERLQKYNVDIAFKHYNDGKSEAIKEFWNMLKRKSFGIIDPDSSIKVVDVADGDNLVKEMEEKQNG